MFMEHQRLLEKHAKAAGLGDIKVTWSVFSGGTTINDALLSGDLHFASGGVTPFLLLWDRSRASSDVRGVVAMTRMPMYLNTRNPSVKTIRDLGANDRIAVLAPKSAMQAILLQMASAQAFGDAQYAKLDPITVGVPLSTAAIAILSGKGEITSDFTVPPFAYQEIDTPGIRNILKSYDILGGPTSFSLVYTAAKFREANPKTYVAFIAALKEAVTLVNRNRDAALDIYVEISKDKTDRKLLQRMLQDPDITYDIAPRNIMKYAEFMHKVGTLKTKPASWKDFFLPGEVHDISGS
jgi:NitT/TauT family transport system substrate-binding protein